MLRARDFVRGCAMTGKPVAAKAVAAARTDRREIVMSIFPEFCLWAGKIAFVSSRTMRVWAQIKNRSRPAAFLFMTFL